MATQTLEFSAGTGLTLSCKLFALGSDTVVATQTATEKTNDLNRYSVAFTDIPAGAYRLNAFVGAVGGFANEVYDLTLETATFSPRSESFSNVIEDTQDIQSRLPAALAFGYMPAYLYGASNLGADSISSRIATNIVDGSYSWPAAVTVIQVGLATSAGVTSAFTEIKGATWDSGTDTLEAIRNASGGGSGVSALLPAIGVVPVRVDQTMLTAFVGETIDVAIVVYQSDGTTPMDLSGKTLEVCFEGTTTTDVAVVGSADITVSGDDNNIVTFAYPSAVTGSVANYHWSLRDASAPKTVWQYGTLYCKRAALKDA